MHAGVGTMEDKPVDHVSNPRSDRARKLSGSIGLFCSAGEEL